MKNSLPFWVAALFACLTLSGGELLAQGRKSISISDPGGFHTVGAGNVTSGLTGNSYGLGSVQSGNSPSNEILRSSMGGPASYTAYRPGGDAGAGSLSGLLSAPTLGNSTRGGGTTMAPNMGDLSNSAGAISTLMKGNDPASLGGVYLNMIGDLKTEVMQKNQPIKSLSPSTPSMYKNYLDLGETAFRANDFQRAFDEFHLANTISNRDWASLLSMSHARFALSANSYAEASRYFRKALMYFPELPVIPLQPRDFYGEANKNKYADSLIRLESHCRKNPQDAEAALLLAYYAWFGQDVAGARNALSSCLTAAGNADDDLSEAARTFWRGMVASGKVSGDLLPASAPAKANTATPATSPGSTAGSPSSGPATALPR